MRFSKDQAILAGSTLGTSGVIEAFAHSHTRGLVFVVGAVAAYGIAKYGPTKLDLSSVVPSFYDPDGAGDGQVKKILPQLAKPAKVQQPQDEEAVVDEDPYDAFGDEVDDELRAPSAGTAFFSQALRTFTPSFDQIYIGVQEDGTPIYSNVDNLLHVAIAGATGGGKSSIMRMLLAQLCAAGAHCLLLNPHYTRFDRKASPPEDWTPYEPYLIDDPLACSEYDRIEYWLKQIATELLPKRLYKHKRSMPMGKPYFIILDEIPAIMKHVEGAGSYLADILREGRKLGIYVVMCSQDLLVKTIDPDGNGSGVRACYRTGYYVGGDATTARTLLNLRSAEIPEGTLGKGTTMLRHASLVKSQRVKVPYFDNESLYSLLGPSTFEESQYQDEELDELVPVNAGQTRRQVSTSMDLDTIINLAGQGAITQEQMMKLIQMLPEQKTGEMEMPQPKPSPDEELLQRATEKYNEGITSGRKLAAALDVTVDKAYKLIYKIENNA